MILSNDKIFIDNDKISSDDKDTINIIETIAKSIPSDWIVYVKEHPAMLTDRFRSKNFYLSDRIFKTTGAKFITDPV